MRLNIKKAAMRAEELKWIVMGRRVQPFLITQVFRAHRPLPDRPREGGEALPGRGLGDKASFPLPRALLREALFCPPLFLSMQERTRIGREGRTGLMLSQFGDYLGGRAWWLAAWGSLRFYFNSEEGFNLCMLSWLVFFLIPDVHDVEMST